MSNIEIKNLKDSQVLSKEAMAKRSGGYTVYKKSNTLYSAWKVESLKTSWSWGVSSIKLY